MSNGSPLKAVRIARSALHKEQRRPGLGGEIVDHSRG